MPDLRIRVSLTELIPNLRSKNCIGSYPFEGEGDDEELPELEGLELTDVDGELEELGDDETEVEGEADREGELETEVEGDEEALGDELTLVDGLTEAEILEETLVDGETELEGLLLIEDDTDELILDAIALSISHIQY